MLKRFLAWRERPSAPGPVGLTAVAFAALFLPALLGAVLGWSPWTALALMVPGFVLLVRVGRTGARMRGLRSSKDTPSEVTAMLVACCALVPIAVVLLDPEGLLALVVAGATLLAELAVRVGWWRADRRASARLAR